MALAPLIFNGVVRRSDTLAYDLARPTGVPPSTGIDVTALTVSAMTGLSTAAAFPDLAAIDYFTGADVGDGAAEFIVTAGSLAAVGLQQIAGVISDTTLVEGTVTVYARWSDGVNERTTQQFAIGFVDPVTPEVDVQAPNTPSPPVLTVNSPTSITVTTYNPTDTATATDISSGMQTRFIERSANGGAFAQIAEVNIANPGVTDKLLVRDIGTPPGSASATQVGSRWDFALSGGTVNGAADVCKFPSLVLPAGNRVTLIARVPAFTAEQTYAAVGIQIRQNDTPGSPVARLQVFRNGTSGLGVHMQARAGQDGSIQGSSFAVAGLPADRWIMLDKAADSGVVTGYCYNENTGSWQQIGQFTISLSGTYLVGCDGTNAGVTDASPTTVSVHDFSINIQGTNNYTDTSVTGGNSYRYRVRYADVEGNISAYSDPSLAAITGAEPDPGPAPDVDYEALGYVVVANWPNIYPDSPTQNSFAGLQAAIEYAYSQRRTLIWPSDVTYYVNDTLRYYKWRPWQSSINGPLNTVGREHISIGSAAGARPKIKLMASAPLFDNASSPRPVVCFRTFKASNSSGTSTTVLPSHPLLNPPNYEDSTPDFFEDEFRQIDIDTSGHVGAIGLYMPTAQGATLAQSRIVATSSYCGLWGFPGRNGGCMDIEVEGGRYGVSNRNWTGLGSMAGGNIAGLKLYRQTESPFLLGDFVPLAVTGLEIIRTVAGPAVQMTENSNTANATLVLCDGKITMVSGVAIDNTVGKNLHVRNVYVSGTNDVIKSGAAATRTAAGTWKRINEYQSNDLDGAASPSSGTSMLRAQAMINGTISRVQEPVASISASVSVPPDDLVSRHIIRIHDIDDGDPFEMVDPAQAGGTNALSHIQGKVNAAHTAGHGRVAVPHGTFHLGSPGLNLRSTTKLMCVGRKRTTFYPHSTWQPTTGTPPIITTDDDADATTQLHSCTIEIRCIGGSGGNTTTPYTQDRFSHVQWRAGRFSSTFGVDTDKQYVAPTIPCNTRIVWEFTGNGGGRHYRLYTDGRGRGAVGHRVLKINGTSQPLWVYGLNMETAKNIDVSYTPLTNCEITGASNVRLFGMKREGSAPTVIIDDSQNIGLFAGGGMRNSGERAAGYCQITGTSDDVVIANMLTQSYDGSSDDHPTLIEDLDTDSAHEIIWPEGVSIYKRGALDDAAMEIA